MEIMEKNIDECLNEGMTVFSVATNKENIIVNNVNHVPEFSHPPQCCSSCQDQGNVCSIYCLSVVAADF